MPARRQKPGGRTLQATYDIAMNTHGSIGPSCAVADFKDGFLTVWTPTQACHLLRPQLATMLSCNRRRAAAFLSKVRAAMAGMAPMTALPKQP